MGKKKHSAFKNVIVSLGCAAFAGVYGIGGCYLVSSYVNNGETSTVPAWLDKVEIQVREETESEAVNETVPPETAAEQEVQEPAGGNDNFSDNILQEPRFPQEVEETEPAAAETESIEETQNEETQIEETQIEEIQNEKTQNEETQIEDEEESQTEQISESETMTEHATEGMSETEKQTQESKKSTVEVNHVEVIQQAETATAVVADVTAVVKAAMPCVVSITNEYTAYDYWYDEEIDEELNGSGIIVAQSEEELLIVTNYHVIEDNNNLYVQFIDDAEATAYVKGTSPDHDLAIVSVFLEDMSDETLKSIAIAALGDSDSLQVGEPAIAIGNSLGYGQSVTTGVISALNRDIYADDPDFSQGYLIQTDAAINPGNSGGALLNVRGEVIGINSSKIADYVIEGMGYAIPISTAKPIIDDLIQKETRKKVPAEERAFLGISGTDVTEDAIERYEMPEGVFVSAILEDTPAERAGILKGDIITYIDGEKVLRMSELQSRLEYYAAGTEVDIVLMRQSAGEYREMTITVTLGHKEN